MSEVIKVNPFLPDERVLYVVECSSCMAEIVGETYDRLATANDWHICESEAN